jgi:hypothetical protein
MKHEDFIRNARIAAKGTLPDIEKLRADLEAIIRNHISEEMSTHYLGDDYGEVVDMYASILSNMDESIGRPVAEWLGWMK